MTQKILDAKYPAEIRYLIEEKLKKYDLANGYMFTKPLELNQSIGKSNNEGESVPSQMK